MPVTSFDKKLLFRLLGYELDDKALESQTSKMGLSVEEQTKDELVVELPSNRPDLLGTVGFARMLKNFMHRSKKYVYKLSSQEPIMDIIVGAKVKKVRPAISGLVVNDVKFDDASLKDVINFTEKLCDTYGRKRMKISIGMHNLEVIKAPLHYDVYGDEEFVPLNGSKSMKYSTIVAEHDKGLAYGHITRSKTKTGHVALKDEQGTLALIPIINSERTKVTTGTRNLFIDVTGTSDYAVGKTADILASLFLDLGCAVKPVTIVNGEKRSIVPEMESARIEVPVFEAEREIGVAIGYTNVLSLVNKMGYEGVTVGESARVNVPAYRADVLNEQDVIEDIAIAYGYDYIRPLLITATQQGGLERSTLLNKKASHAMAGLGFIEMLNSFLTNEKANFDDMRLQRPDSYVKVKNSVTVSLTMMRTWLIPSLLKNISLSKNDRMPQRIFEVDLAFNLWGDVVSEAYHLAAVETGPKANFNDIKASFNSLNTLLDSDLEIQAADNPSFIEGRCARITLGGKTLGFMGEIHPEVLSKFGIEEPTIALEIDLAGLQA